LVATFADKLRLEAQFRDQGFVVANHIRVAPGAFGISEGVDQAGLSL
jgi:hypothetical protein